MNRTELNYLSQVLVYGGKSSVGKQKRPPLNGKEKSS